MKKTVVPDLLPLLPAPLKSGDTIGLFCPAGPVRNIEQVNAGIALLQDMGFRVRILEELRTQIDNGMYLSATDTVRAHRLHTLWDDEQVKALMAVRGGYGCLRLLDRLDFTLFRANPKLLIGFSDLTVLLASTFIEAGMVGLHGPVVSSLPGTDSASRERLFSLLTGSYQPYPLDNTIEILRPGTGRGRIIVGNLTTISHLIGTPWEPAFAGSVLIIEDTGEPMYKVDRLLTHLACGGRLANLTGLILGTFDSGASPATDNQLLGPLFERVCELTAHTNYPIWGNFPIGHLSRNQAIPYGMEATMENGQTGLRLHPETVQKYNHSTS